MATKKEIKPIPTDNAAREKALETALNDIQKAFGQGSIMIMGEGAEIQDLDIISTGSISLDMATGVGGVPKGRIIEIFGPESSGKTTLTLHIVAEAQKKGGKAAFIDAEHALDPVYARNLGVKVDELLVSQPDNGEQALEIADMLARSGALDVIVIDSVAALVPKAEIQGEMGDSHVGLQARLTSSALRKLTGAVNKSGTCIIFINQLREKIGVMFGNPETTTGGRALKFYSTMRFDVRRVETIKKGENVLGNRTRVKVVKNKVAPPFKKAEFDIMYGTGISRSGDIVDCATEFDIMDKSGSWYSYMGERIGQGRDNVKQYLEDHPDLMEEIYQKLLEELKEQKNFSDKTFGAGDAGELPGGDGALVDEDGVIIDD